MMGCAALHPSYALNEEHANEHKVSRENLETCPRNWVSFTRFRISMCTTSIGVCSDMINTINKSHPLYARLRATRPFIGLTEQQFAGLIKAARMQDAAVGMVLIRAGDVDSDYLVLLDGELEVRRHYLSVQGVEEIEIGRLFSSHGAGEVALLYAVPRQASVRAMVPSRVLRIDSATMEELLAWPQRFAEPGRAKRWREAPDSRPYRRSAIVAFPSRRAVGAKNAPQQPAALGTRVAKCLTSGRGTTSPRTCRGSANFGRA